jgi:MtN3 and saliva related transmembrane protein
MNLFTNFVGYAAAVVGTSMMVPQVVKSFRTKQVDDLALPSVVLYILNCALWLGYGILIRSWPVILANALGLMVAISQFVLKWRYGAEVSKG